MLFRSGGINGISIKDGKEVWYKATMAFARDWVASTQTHAMYPGSGPSCGGNSPTSCSSCFLLQDNKIWATIVLLKLFLVVAGLGAQPAGGRR